MGAAQSGNLRSAGGPSAKLAKEFMDETPVKKRKKFAQVLHGKSSGMKSIKKPHV